MIHQDIEPASFRLFASDFHRWEYLDQKKPWEAILSTIWEIIEHFAGVPVEQYLYEMSLEGTYGDKMTLRAIENIFNVKVVSYKH